MEFGRLWGEDADNTKLQEAAARKFDDIMRSVGVVLSRNSSGAPAVVTQSLRESPFKAWVESGEERTEVDFEAVGSEAVSGAVLFEASEGFEVRFEKIDENGKVTPRQGVLGEQPTGKSVLRTIEHTFAHKAGDIYQVEGPVNIPGSLTLYPIELTASDACSSAAPRNKTNERNGARSALVARPWSHMPKGPSHGGGRRGGRPCLCVLFLFFHSHLFLCVLFLFFRRCLSRSGGHSHSGCLGDRSGDLSGCLEDLFRRRPLALALRVRIIVLGLFSDCVLLFHVEMTPKI